MFISIDKKDEHAKNLKIGLSKLGSGFTASLCYWCEGTTIRNFERCSVCGKGVPGWRGNGLLWPESSPAPDSVAYQVLNAAK